MKNIQEFCFLFFLRNMFHVFVPFWDTPEFSVQTTEEDGCGLKNSLVWKICWFWIFFKQNPQQDQCEVLTCVERYDIHTTFRCLAAAAQWNSVALLDIQCTDLLCTIACVAKVQNIRYKYPENRDGFDGFHWEDQSIYSRWSTKSRSRTLVLDLQIWEWSSWKRKHLLFVVFMQNPFFSRSDNWMFVCDLHVGR